MREKIGSQLNIGGLGDRSGVAMMLGGLLVGQFGFMPLVAAPVAALLVSKVFKAGLDETCLYWGRARGQQQAKA